MVHVPPDVWMYIATFIPANVLRNMFSLNSVFFNLAMNERYREVTINFMPDETRKLVRLRDPEVSKRVRFLKVNPHSTQDFVEKRNGEKSWKKGLTSVMKRVRDVSPIQKCSGAEAMAKYSESHLDWFYQTILDTVSCFSNVTHCDISWWDLSTIKHLYPFIPVAWASFGSNLRALTLAADLEGLQQLASSSSPFRSLEELKLEFLHNVYRMNDTSDMTCLVEVLAPFVNGLSQTLQHLSVTSWASLELSSFFQQLSFFPLLRRLTIRVSFNKAFSHDFSGLTRLLHDHSHTLSCVILRFNPSGWMAPSTEDPLIQWMAEAASDDLVLANLETLHIYPTMLSSGFNFFLTYLGRSANTLTVLTVRDRYLSYDEVDKVVAVFLHRPPEARLKYLRLNVRNLSVRLLDLLQAKMPALEELELYVGEGWTEGGGPSTPDILQSELQDRTYPDWKLQDVGIWKGGAKVDGEIMMLLTERIPSLRSVWGQGDLLITH